MKNNKDICILTDRYLDMRAKKFGLTAAQGGLLTYIIKCGGADTSELNRELSISKSTVSSILKKLSDKDFIKIETLKEDNRRKKVIPTKKAMRVKNGIQREFSLVEEEIFNSFSQDELETVLELQTRFLNALRQNFKNYIETEEQ